MNPEAGLRTGPQQCAGGCQLLPTLCRSHGLAPLRSSGTSQDGSPGFPLPLEMPEIPPSQLHSLGRRCC